MCVRGKTRGENGNSWRGGVSYSSDAARQLCREEVVRCRAGKEVKGIDQGFLANVRGWEIRVAVVGAKSALMDSSLTLQGIERSSVFRRDGFFSFVMACT